MVTIKVKSFPGDYTTALYECEGDNWYYLSRSTFGPGTIFNGLNSFNKILKPEALKIIEDSKDKPPM